ncbi:MAG: hypothetical protein FD126_1659 [Elusimicrobia bacterium]|nr:MAG: hypothetical protein FD126_1659 [Elusimicrobiota bacterium]
MSIATAAAILISAFSLANANATDEDFRKVFDGGGKNVDCERAARNLNEMCFEGRHPEYSRKADSARSALAGCRTQFAERCQGWDPVFGTCKPERHKPLQEAVKATCNQERSCLNIPAPPPDQCKKLEEFLNRNVACYQSRRDINQECYGGGDTDHKDEEEKARLAGEICLGRMVNDECANIPRKFWQ